MAGRAVIDGCKMTTGVRLDADRGERQRNRLLLGNLFAIEPGTALIRPPHGTRGWSQLDWAAANPQ